MMNNFSQKDKIFIKEALRLAKKAEGRTNPNPMVGTVIVINGEVIGKGYHQKVGLPHAEIEALNSVKGSVKGATLYVNLEPCIHYGRTPPCVDQILQSGINRVICSIIDPNPKVNGMGIKKLKEAGIDVEVGMLADEARRVNEAFFTFHEKKRPFIALKFAASLDGKIATKTGDSKWITNEKARSFARNLRSQYQAILVGINTILRDDPHLGVRMKGKKDPLRIVLDSKLRIPLNSLVLRDNNILIVVTKAADQNKKEKLQSQGIEIIEYENKMISLRKLLEDLYKREIISVLVEGGGSVLGSFLDERMVDKVYAFQAPLLIGGEKAVTAIGGEGINTIIEAAKLKNVTFKRFDDNWLTIGYAN